MFLPCYRTAGVVVVVLPDAIAATCCGVRLHDICRPGCWHAIGLGLVDPGGVEPWENVFSPFLGFRKVK